MAGTDDEKHAFPLWPAHEYAQECALAEWKAYAPREITLDTLLDVLIPKLQESGDLVAVFPTPNQKGVIPDFAVLVADLKQELGRIE